MEYDIYDQTCVICGIKFNQGACLPYCEKCDFKRKGYVMYTNQPITHRYVDLYTQTYQTINNLIEINNKFYVKYDNLNFLVPFVQLENDFYPVPYGRPIKRKMIIKL